MPTCCTQDITLFVNEAITTVPYSGDKPTVSLYYYIGGVWMAAGVATPMTFGPASVTVDHGGASTGAIKLIQ